MKRTSRFIGFLIVVLSVSMLHSAPRSFVPIELVQPDGTRLHVYASGDEYYNWVHDKDNYTILQDPSTHYYVYAVLGKGMLLPSPYVVGTINPKVAGLTSGVNIYPLSPRQQKLLQTIAASTVLKKAQTSGFTNLVIFIRFKSEPEFSQGFSRYDSMFNSSIGPSLKEYYHEVSWNQFDVTSFLYQHSGNLITSYEDSHTRGYFEKYDAVTNPGGYTNDADARETALLNSALAAVKPLVPPTLPMDNNNDGFVDNVTFVVSGSAAGWADLLWPHMSYLTPSEFRINGAAVSAYNFQLDDMFDVGVLCHEMGHSVGMPDLYRYTYQAISPCGSWDIMCSGNAHMTNYMKYKYGKWISSIPEITSNGTYALNVSTSPVKNVYKILSSRSAREYFLLEFRKKTGLYESELPGSGLIIYRINDRADGNSLGPPDEIYIYRPNGTLWTNGLPSNAYLTSDVARTAIGDSTNPSSFLSDGLPGGLSITNVGPAAGDSIRFDVKIISSVPVTNDYSANKTAFNWVDISSSGSVIQNWVNGTLTGDTALDDGYTSSAIPLGINFNYYGHSYNSISVAINGLVSFTQQALNVADNGAPSLSSFGYFSPNIFWPGNIQFPASIAVAYNDYDLKRTDTYGGGRIMYQTVNNRFILSWINVGTFERKGDTTNSFQLVLDASNSSLTVNVQRFGVPVTAQSIKIGIQKDSTNGLSWLDAGDDTVRIPANGSSVVFIPLTSTGIAGSSELPAQLNLEQNYPNPFNPTTTMRFSIGTYQHTSLRIYDLLGREVAVLMNEETPPGSYEVVWDARSFASGIYFYRLSTGQFTQVKKMILMK